MGKPASSGFRSGGLAIALIMPELNLNGAARAVAATTVAELVEELGLAGQAVAVEVNRAIVPKRSHGETVLRPGDAVEVVTLVGGG